MRCTRRRVLLAHTSSAGNTSSGRDSPTPAFGFGSPSSLLYRADGVRDKGGFYPNASAEADTSACFKHLKDSEFGFVYQVLCYERTDEQTQSSKSAQLNRYAPS